jgi:hypothetical protein
VGNHVTKRFGGDGRVDGGGGVGWVRVLHSFNNVVNLHSGFNHVSEIKCAIQDSFTVGIVGEGADEVGNGSGDKGGWGGLSIVFLAFLGEEFVEGLCFKNSGPGGVFDVSGVIGDKDVVKADVFPAFYPDAKFTKSHGLAFSTQELAESSGLVKLSCLG